MIMYKNLNYINQVKIFKNIYICMYVYINYNNCFTPALPIKTINDDHVHHDDHLSLILIVHIHNIKQMQLLLYLIQGMHF